MLKVDKINVFYDGLQALLDVSLEVNEGEIVSIVGSNGAGKTTLLNTISGLLHPKSGSINFLGKRIDKLSPSHRVKLGIAHVPEGRRLFPHCSVMENLRMGAYARGGLKKKDEMLEWVFQLFPILKERRNQLAGTLSGGEQQMLAIGRGLISNPKLQMLDEPSLGLAPKLTLKIFEIIKKINEEGVTVLLVEQNVRQSLMCADRAYVIEEGKNVLQGEGAKLVDDKYVKRAYLGA